MAASLLVKFYKNTKRKPERIIFFRDGVSEGQFQATIDVELSALRLACLSLDRVFTWIFQKLGLKEWEIMKRKMTTRRPFLQPTHYMSYLSQ